MGATMFSRGVVGTWKNILTSEQSQIIDEILLSHLQRILFNVFLSFESDRVKLIFCWYCMNSCKPCINAVLYICSFYL